MLVGTNICQETVLTQATELLVQYARYHRDPRNIATHWVGIPLIVFSLCVVLARWQFSLAGVAIGMQSVLWVLAAVWYLRQGRSAVVLATVGLTGLLAALAQPLGQAPLLWWLVVGWGGLVVGWAFQFVGHYWEGRKPAFVDDLRGLLVGPMFVVAECWFALGGGQSLRQHIVAQAGPVLRQRPPSRADAR